MTVIALTSGVWLALSSVRSGCAVRRGCCIPGSIARTDLGECQWVTELT
jgi:hypothetical protein